MEEKTRTRLQNVVLVLALGMAVLFSVLLGISKSQKGVLFEQTLLKATPAPEGTAYTGRAHGDEIAITVTQNGAVTTVEYVIGDWLHDVCTVEYPLAPVQTEHGLFDGLRVTKNGEILFEGAYDATHSDMGWYKPDGTWNPLAGDNLVRFGNDPWNGYTASASNVLSFAQGPALTARGSWAMHAVMLFLALLVALDAAFPLTVFRLQHCCDVRDPEPSDFYLCMQRVGWVVYPVLLFVGFVFALRALP